MLCITSSFICMDEEQKQSVNEEAEVNSPEEATPSETNDQQVEVQETDQEAQPEENQDSNTDKRRGKGAEKRIHQLVDKVKTLEQQLSEYTGEAEVDTQQGGYLDYNQIGQQNDQGERELTITDLQAITRLEIEREKTINRINQESKEAMTDYPELNPDDERFDPELSEIVTDSVLHKIQANPRQSVKALVQKYMKPYRKSVENAADGMRQELAKQVSDTALRPTGTVSKSEKSVDEMSIEEIEAKFGTVR